MTEEARLEIRETIESLVVELRGIAQPHEVAQLRELALDAADAETQEQLAEIRAQVDSLRAFCMSRAQSAATHHIVVPSKTKGA